MKGETTKDVLARKAAEKTKLAIILEKKHLKLADYAKSVGRTHAGSLYELYRGERSVDRMTLAILRPFIKYLGYKSIDKFLKDVE